MAAAAKIAMDTPRMFASFRLGKGELAIPIASLQEVVNYPEKVTTVPLAPNFLAGLFNLRGMVIPIVDVAVFFGSPSGEPAGRKIAIVANGGARLGLLFDATSEILTVMPETISEFDAPAEGRKDVIRGVLKLEGGERIVEILDPEALVRIENIPQLLERSSDNVLELRKKASKRLQCITFRTGKLDFGLRISAISEIIRVPEIQKTSVAASHCLGLVNLRGSVVPIVDLKAFLQHAATDDPADEEARRILILKIDKVQIGFLVDSVDSIVTLFEEDVLPIPLMKQEKSEMLRGLLPLASGTSAVLLDEAKILSSDEILDITRGHNSVYGRDERAEKAERSGALRKPYLSFKMKYLLSAQLGTIDEIAKLSEDVIRPPGYPAFVAGMLKMRGEVVTLIDLRSYYGLGSAEMPVESRILIVKGRSSKFGLLVDSVESIDTLDESQKMKMPSLLAQDAVSSLQGDMTDMVEMPTQDGQLRTFMILDVPLLLEKLEAQFTR